MKNTLFYTCDESLMVLVIFNFHVYLPNNYKDGFNLAPIKASEKISTD